jgi:hypothetical protein
VSSTSVDIKLCRVRACQVKVGAAARPRQICETRPFDSSGSVKLANCPHVAFLGELLELQIRKLQLLLSLCSFQLVVVYCLILALRY